MESGSNFNLDDRWRRYKTGSNSTPVDGMREYVDAGREPDVETNRGSTDQYFNNYNSATGQATERGSYIYLIVCTVIYILGMALAGFLSSGTGSIAMTVVGYNYLNDCPAGQYIPIYLMVGGSFGMFSSFCGTCIRASQGNVRDQNNTASYFKYFINTVILGWTIAGMVLVYDVYGRRSDDRTSPNYCNATLYMFTVCKLAIPIIVIFSSIMYMAFLYGCGWLTRG